MSNLSATTQAQSFIISNTDVEGPLNLERTLLSAQTAEPEWLREGTAFTDLEIFNGSPVKYTLEQAGGVDQFTVRVSLIGSVVSEDTVNQLRSHLITVLRLGDKIEAFYGKFTDPKEPLSGTFGQLRGLRLMRATNLFESLIFSIISQNNSVPLLNRRARLLMRNYGAKADLPDGSSNHMFPTPEALAKLTAGELRSKTSMGYRAKPIIQVSKMVYKDELRLDELANRPYDKAFEILLDLPGVGPKVADCFLLYGLGKMEAAPVDVWIHRIVSKLYFRRKKVTRSDVARFLRERFGEWAGYAQLYLFDFARRGL